jgi:hypothetical protein
MPERRWAKPNFPTSFGAPGTLAGVGGGEPQGSILSRFLVHDTTGKLLMEFGKLGSGDGEFKEPTAVALDGQGFIYVCDSGNGRIQKFKL